MHISLGEYWFDFLECTACVLFLQIFTSLVYRDLTKSVGRKVSSGIKYYRRSSSRKWTTVSRMLVLVSRNCSVGFRHQRDSVTSYAVVTQSQFWEVEDTSNGRRRRRKRNIILKMDTWQEMCQIFSIRSVCWYVMLVMLVIYSINYKLSYWIRHKLKNSF